MEAQNVRLSTVPVLLGMGDFVQAHGRMPSSIELQNHIGLFKHRWVIVKELQRYERFGWIERDGRNWSSHGSMTDRGRVAWRWWQSNYDGLRRQARTRTPRRRQPFDAMAEQRTVYPRNVRSVTADTQVLFKGSNNVKIGSPIAKGACRGWPLYYLTLQERATCPAYCRQWHVCYGNNMVNALRFQHGRALEDAIERDIGVLAARHPEGFMVRLHVLGDFYSIDYVGMWRRLLQRFKMLRVFGYSARDRFNDPIGRALLETRQEFGGVTGRFAIRFSNVGEVGEAIVIEAAAQVPFGFVVCPEQMNATATCSTCGLCWTMQKGVAFLQH
jgi:hypothetical protein